MRGLRRMSGIACAVLLLVSGTACTAAHPAARKTRVAAPSPPAFPHVTVRPLEGQPVSVIDVGDGKTWTALFDGQAIDREGSAPIEVAGLPSDLVVTPFGVWAALVDGPRGFVARYDVRTGEEEMAFTVVRGQDTSPEQLAYADGLVWVIDASRQVLVTIDAASGEILHQEGMDDAPLDVAAAGRHAYVVSDGYSSVAQVRAPADRGGRWTVDGAGGVCTGPSALAVEAADAWIACTTGDEVIQVDPRRFETYAEVAVDHPDRIVLDGDHVLAVLGDGPSVAVIDRSTGDVLRTIRLGDDAAPKKPLDAVISGPRLVVVSPGTDQSYSVPLDVLYSDAG